MSLLGNILWILLGGGIFIFFEYLLGALFLCLTIVGIPFGLQCLKLAHLGLLPFGKQVVQTPPASGCLSTLMNVVWILMFGWIISLTHLVFAFLTAVTIIGIPFAMQHMKLVTLGLMPFGHSVKEV